MTILGNNNGLFSCGYSAAFNCLKIQNCAKTFEQFKFKSVQEDLIKEAVFLFIHIGTKIYIQLCVGLKERSRFALQSSMSNFNFNF